MAVRDDWQGKGAGSALMQAAVDLADKWIHVPLEEQPTLFAKLAQWLKPQGYLLATVGRTAWTGTESNWRDVAGATMYWSHTDAGAYRRWFEEFGLRIVYEGFLPEDDGGHTVLLGQKAGTQ